MLTLFEYLRQRAFESVLTGAQEALEFLETQGHFDKLNTRINDRLQTIEQNAAAATTGTTVEDPPKQSPSGPKGQPAEHDGKASQPRLRKRSKRKGSRQ